MYWVWLQALISPRLTLLILAFTLLGEMLPELASERLVVYARERNSTSAPTQNVPKPRVSLLEVPIHEHQQTSLLAWTKTLSTKNPIIQPI